jgi:hypothetical protein
VGLYVRVEGAEKELEIMKMLSDEEILAVKSPQERSKGYDIRGPYFVLQKTLTDNAVDAYVLLEWRGEPDTPFVPSIGKRSFTDDGLGELKSHGYPIWGINEPPFVINDLPLDTRLKTIAEDFLRGEEDSLSSDCLSTLSNLKQTLEQANFEQEQVLSYCYALYQRMKKWNRKENEQEARKMDEELKRIVREGNGRPSAQAYMKFFNEHELCNEADKPNEMY